MGRASALMVLAILLSGAIGTQIIAPFMEDRSPTPLALGMFALCVVSAVLVIPYPRASEEPR
jgi:DHA1 family bicyclomycin/chloramphenicol resistance-like MFS transporter